METIQTSRRLAAWRREWLIDRKLAEVDEEETKEFLDKSPSSDDEPLPSSLTEVAPFDTDVKAGDILLFSKVHTPDFDFPLHAVCLNPNWTDNGSMGVIAPMSWLGEPATRHEYKCLMDMGPWKRVISCDLGFSARWDRLKFWKAGSLNELDFKNAHDVFKSWITGGDVSSSVAKRTCPDFIEDDDDPRVEYQNLFLEGLQPLINHGQPIEEEDEEDAS